MTFAPDRATWRRVDGDIEIRTEIVVSPEDDVELRRVSLTNHGRAARSLDLTSYAEVVLAPGDADLAHPAFSNLFVETIAVPERDALICVAAAAQRHRPPVSDPRAQRARPARRRHRVRDRSRRASSAAAARVERPAALARHRVRSRTPPAPCSIRSSACGSRCAFRRAAPPASRSRPGSPTTRTVARQLIEKYHDRRAVARALALASTHSQIELRHLGLTIEETMRFQRLAGRLLYGDPRLRVRRRRARPTRAARPSSGSTGSPATCRSCCVRMHGRQRAAAVPRAAQGARVPAAQGLRLRSGRAERARVELPAGSAERARADRREQSRAELGRSPGRRVPAPGGPDAARGPDAAARPRRASSWTAPTATCASS